MDEALLKQIDKYIKENYSGAINVNANIKLRAIKYKKDEKVNVAAAVTLIGGLFMKGKNVSFPAGSKMNAKVVADTDLKVKMENLAEEMSPSKPHGVVIQLAQ